MTSTSPPHPQVSRPEEEMRRGWIWVNDFGSDWTSLHVASRVTKMPVGTGETVKKKKKAE